MPKFKNNFLIKIGGQNASENFYDALEEVVVDSSLSMPGMFSIRLYDPELTWVDNPLLAIGKEVEIQAVLDELASGGSASSTGTVLIKGEITALEPHFSANGKVEMMVRGYDKSHRLHRGRQTRTFLKMKDSDIVSKIAGEAGLSAKVDATSLVYEYVIQYNQTNMEFLLSRAERIGYQVYTSGTDLNFKKGDTSSSSMAELKFLENLSEFEPRWTAHQQTDKMIVKGWDPKKKEAIKSENTPNGSLSQGGMASTGGALTKSAFSAADEVVVDRPVFTADEAKSLATGLSNDISREFLQADGVCAGTPTVQAGCKITIKNVGTRFSGDYFVTSATHIKNADGYETRFSITGRHPNTLSSLLHADHSAGDSAGVSGVVTGLVTNLNDPDDLGRVKLKFAWLGEIETDWVRIASPMAGPGRGLEILPEVNDEVLVAFEHGDIHRPYIVGVLWNSKDKPPAKNSEAVAAGKVNQRIFKTRKGHTLLFDDKDGEEQISIKSKSGHQLILDDKSGSENITIKDKGGNSMVIKSSDNSLSIKVTGDFNVTATGKITLKSTQDMTLKSTANAKLKGMQLAMEGTAKSELKGAMVSVNGSAQTEVKAGAMVQIQGAIVKIN